MKMSESLLRTMIEAIRETNKSFVACQPTIPQWTTSFAFTLERLLDKQVKA